MTRVYLSLGTNMGERLTYLQRAVKALSQLPQTQLIQVSSVYETAAWGKTDQADFLNIVCQLETDLSAPDLLTNCQTIEQELDRVRHEHWGSRTIDIDILLFGQEVIATENLQVPHPYMTQRAFVLVPLSELSSDVLVPNSELSVSDYLGQVDSSDVVLVNSPSTVWKK